MKPLLAVIAGAWLLAAPRGHAQQPVFRGSAATVVVDVSVTAGGEDVPDLTAKDFRLADNGVPQTITHVSRQALPIDVTFVPDISGQTEGPLLDSLRRAIDDVLARLGTNDRASLVLFDPWIREVEGIERSRLSIDAERRPNAGSASALLDAVATTLIRPSDPGRRRMAVLFTDGQDAGSFLDEADLLDVARRSDVTVFTVAVTDGTTRTPMRAANAGLLNALAEATGGAVAVVQRDQDVSESFTRALAAFRTTYVLQYTPAKVEPGGWHEVEVRLARTGRYQLRARRGYFGDAGRGRR
jgi:VWFA-related protein